MRAWREPWTVKARRWLAGHRTLVTATAAAVLVAVVLLTAATVLLTAANEQVRHQRDGCESEIQSACLGSCVNGCVAV